MSGGLRPPRVADWLAGVSTPPPDRDQVLGDLHERFVRRVASLGPRAAKRWYRAQALRLFVALVPRRVLRSIPEIVAPGTVRSALRSIVRSPRESLLAATTLAVGIAAPGAMFALADGATASLPRDPEDRVVRISVVDRRGRTHMGIPWPLFEAWRQSATGPGRALSSLEAFRSPAPGQVAVGGGEGYATRYWGVYATAGLLHLLKVRPVVGRLYAENEDGGLPAVLIREDVWQERFDGDPQAIGQVLRVDGVDHLVVGVLPARFGFPVDHRIWMQPSGDEDQAWSVVGRLVDDASSATAGEQLAAVLAPAPGGEGPSGVTVRVQRFTKAHMAGEDDTARLVGMVSLILVLVTAVNVAAIMLARGVSRSRETAVRLAIGASRGHVIALTLTEALLLAVGGGVLGLLLSRLALRAMLGYLLNQATILPYWVDFHLGARSIVIASILAVVALAVAGGVPALRSSRTDLDGALRREAHGRPGGSAWALTAVVGLEVTLACFLLSVSSVVVQEALTNLRTAAAFPTEGVHTGQLVLRAPDYPDEDARRRFLGRLSDALRTDASVHDVALTSALPGKEGWSLAVGVDGVDADPAEAAPAQIRMVDAPFFSMLGLRAASGRLLSEEDRARTTAVAVVNGAFVRDRGIEGDVVGRRLAVAHARDGAEYAATIVGVVDDRGVTLDERGRPSPGVYLALGQLPPRGTYLMARTREGVSLLQVWQEAVATLDPYLPLGEVRSLDEALSRGQGAATLYLSVFMGLGVATFLVALVGLHGVHSFLLARRVRDIGVRRALGARAGQLIRQSMMRGLRPVWVGLLLGAVPGFLAARSVLPIRPHVLTLALAPVLLVATSVFALWGPTRRASQADPMEVLREG